MDQEEFKKKLAEIERNQVLFGKDSIILVISPLIALMEDLA